MIIYDAGALVAAERNVRSVWALQCTRPGRLRGFDVGQRTVAGR